VRISGIAWAADEPVLAASMNVGADGLLVVFDADEEAVFVVPFKAERIGKPAVSPDGSDVAVPVAPNVEEESGRRGIAVVSLTLQTANVIAEGHFENPAYSPGGDAILATLVEYDGKQRNIVSIDPAGGKVKRLTSDGGSSDAAWTPASEQ